MRCYICGVTACANCGNHVQDNEEFCPVDQTFHGYPNVKLAAREERALLARATRARQKLENRKDQLGGALDKLASEAGVVVNVDPEFAAWLLAQNRRLYSAYGKQLAAQTRRPATVENDQERFSVEARLFGSSADVTYGALTASGGGVTTYGSVALRLRTGVIHQRASLLEENSFSFCRKHRTRLPQGHRATWQARALLITAKLSSRIRGKWSDARLRQLLIHSSGNRATDEFIEVHIWRGFSAPSLESILLERQPTGPIETLTVELARTYAEQAGIAWRPA